ncbi:Uncharacterised protein [Enterobacter cloacae]|nr:Uncharacterised protein [Enterobacter cloacae]
MNGAVRRFTDDHERGSMGDREQLANRSSGAKDSGTSGNIGVQYQSDAYIPRRSARCRVRSLHG